MPFQLVVRDAAVTDAEAGAAWAELQQERLRGMAMFAADLSAGGHLRRSVTVDEARDVLWTYNSAELFELLVVHRHWTPKRYGGWIATALIAALT